MGRITKSQRSRVANSIEEWLSPPGDTIQETIDALGISEKELAEKMGLSQEKLKDPLKGEVPIFQDMAFQLEKTLNIPAHFWVNREMLYQKDLDESKTTSTGRST